MAKSIRELFRLLHINVITEKVDRPHSMIRENWRTPTYVPEDYNEAVDILTHYYQYHHQAWMGGPVMPADMAFGHVREALEKAQGGYVQAMKQALAGREGGLVARVDAIAEEIKQDATEKYVIWVLSTFVAPMDFDSKVALMSEYLNEYAHVLPGEKLMSPYELAANFDAFVKHHIAWINQLRNAIQ